MPGGYCATAAVKLTSLGAIPVTQFLKRAALRARLVEQALPDGGADIAYAHSTVSRYGRMTFWTRLIWANFVRATLFGFRMRSR